jgi:putative aldouronate transport system permease protein
VKISLGKAIKRDKYLYFLLLPGIIFFIIFRYVPMYGLIVAFKDFNLFAGIAESEWVGLKQFERLFANQNFDQIIRNNVIISLLKILIGFPVPVMLAILMNEFGNSTFKKIAQTTLYLPHFISWVVLGGVIFTFLNVSDGVVNEVLKFLGAEPIDFLMSKDKFRGVLIVTDIYKEAGWGTVIYMAAISVISPELYEASYMDGANKFQRMYHITLPSIRSVIIIMLLLRIGYILDAGFFQVWVLYSPPVYSVGDIIDTYVYRKGIKSANYSIGAAAGLFKSVIALILVVLSNRFAKFFNETGLW